jgi:hypothetical protein
MLTRRDFLLGRNRHDQQHDNTAQHQALVNASYPYPEGPGHSGRQKPGSQSLFCDALSKPQPKPLSQRNFLLQVKHANYEVRFTRSSFVLEAIIDTCRKQLTVRPRTNIKPW